MIFTPRTVAIVAAVGAVAVLLQVSFLALMPLLGSYANIVPVVVVSFGLLAGAVPGATLGFGCGLALDTLLGGTLGVWSLALMAAGYLGGRWRESYDIVSSLVPPILGGLLTGVAVLAFAFLNLILGVEAPISLLVLREVMVQALLGGLLTLLVFPAFRRLLRVALIDDGRRARTRRRPPPRTIGAV